MKFTVECVGRHKWSDGWICSKCGMKRADYEEERRKKRADFWVLRYGENSLCYCDSTLYTTARDCLEKIAWNVHRGNPKFKCHQIIRHAKDGSETVYDEYPLPKVTLGYRVPDEYDEQF